MNNAAAAAIIITLPTTNTDAIHVVHQDDYPSGWTRENFGIHQPDGTYTYTARARSGSGLLTQELDRRTGLTRAECARLCETRRDVHIP